VPILNDPEFEFIPETFTLNLSNATGAVIADFDAEGTIEDSDFPPWTIRASSDGQNMEVYLGNPPLHDDPLLWPMDSKEPFLFDLDLGDDVIFVELPADSEGPAGGIEFVAATGINELYVRSGNVRIDSTAVGGSLKTDISKGAELITSRLDQNDVHIDGRLTLLAGGETSRVTELSLAPDGVLDLTDNALVVDYTGASPLAAMRENILSGRGGAGLGARWTGPGINSSIVAEANKSDPEAYSIGFAENATLPLGPYADFRGLPVDETAILIAYTHTGDANLDGLVNDDDATIVGATYAPGTPQPHWALGDFDYNGFVDDDDVTLLGVFYDPPATPAQVALRDAIPRTVAISLREMKQPLAQRENLGAFAFALEQLFAESDSALFTKRKPRL
jgi:hypothetical protein